jgi:TrmH family RNA methyltransferase
MSSETLSQIEVTRLSDLVRDRKQRESEFRFLVEGPHLVAEAILEDPRHVRAVFFTQEAAETHVELLTEVDRLNLVMQRMSQKQAEKISDTRTTQGVFALVERRPFRNDEPGPVLILDAVQDPGNVGTILRTAVWFGVRNILAGYGTADIFSPKVLRATQGAIFSVNIKQDINLIEEVVRLKRDGFVTIATTLDTDSLSLFAYEAPKNFALLLGNESKGISEELLNMCDTRLSIPRFGPIESLNVAVSAAIFLSEFNRK